MNYFKSRKFQEQRREKNTPFKIEHIKKDFQLMKMFLALYLNDFAFEWQLVKQHNLTKSQIQKYSEKLNSQGLISFRLLSELSENMQEAILQITPDFNKIYTQNPKVYVISPYGKQEGKKIISDILKESNTNQGLYDLVQQLLRWSNSFRITKKKILEEENTLFNRTVKFPNGVIIEKNTKKYINLLKEIKVSKIEARAGKDLVKYENKTDLMIIEDIKKELRKEKTPYCGMFSYMTADEINKLIEPLSDKEYKDFKKEERKEAKERIKNLNSMNKDWEYMKHYDKIDDLEKDKIYNEGLDFLNSLQKSD